MTMVEMTYTARKQQLGDDTATTTATRPRPGRHRLHTHGRATRGDTCNKDGDGDRTPVSMRMTAMTRRATTWPVTTDGSCVEDYPESFRAPGLRTLYSDVDDEDCVVIHSATLPVSPAWRRHR